MRCCIAFSPNLKSSFFWEKNLIPLYYFLCYPRQTLHPFYLQVYKIVSLFSLLLLPLTSLLSHSSRQAHALGMKHCCPQPTGFLLASDCLLCMSGPHLEGCISRFSLSPGRVFPLTATLRCLPTTHVITSWQPLTYHTDSASSHLMPVPGFTGIGMAWENGVGSVLWFQWFQHINQWI